MPIAVSLLGCEHPHVADVLGVIVSEADVRLASVWSADRSAVPGPVSSYAVRDPDTAIARADTVVICASLDDRPHLAVRAARAGRPILVWTPVAVSAAEASAVAREIVRSRTPAYPSLFLRQLPALGRLRAVLRSDLLGRLSAVSAGYLSSAALGGAPPAGGARFEDARRPRVGGMTDLGIHLVDALVALGARPRLDAISIDRRGRGRTDVGGVAVGRWADVPLSLRASQIVRPGGIELVVNGSSATATLRDGTLELVSDQGAPERWVGAPPDPAEAVRAFLQRLRTRRLDLNGLQDAIRAHEVLERATSV
jgi:predicted dehydrogenase